MGRGVLSSQHAAFWELFPEYGKGAVAQATCDMDSARATTHSHSEWGLGVATVWLLGITGYKLDYTFYK